MEGRKAGCATRTCSVPQVGTGREDKPQLSAKELIMSLRCWVWKGGGTVRV